MNPLAFIAGPIMPYAAGALLAVTALGGWYLHHSGYESGKASGHAEAVAARADRDVANANVVTLKAQLATSNAAVASMGADTDARIKAGQIALQRAAKREHVNAASVARLEAAGRAGGAVTCPSAKVNRSAVDAIL